MAVNRKGIEGVELDNSVHEHEQMLLGADGKEFWVQIRAKAWVIGFALVVVYFVLRRIWTRNLDVDVLGVPILAAYGLMKIVTPQKPVEAHAVAFYREARRLVTGWLRRRRLGGARIAPYFLMSRTPRSWPWTPLLARANERRNRTDA